MILLAAALLATVVHLAGDSTLDDRSRGTSSVPCASWGSELGRLMTAGNGVRNLACGGFSTVGFERKGRWRGLVEGVRAGDFVIIQFGHNDQKRSCDYDVRERWADPKTTFRDNVRRWVAEVRAKGAFPILCSPICRGTFDAEGKRLVDVEHRTEGVCLRSYRDAMKELSDELACDFVDMNDLTHDHLEAIGKEAAMKYFVISTKVYRSRDGEPEKDVSHPIDTGARAFARLFIEDVRARALPVARLFARRDFRVTDYGAVASDRFSEETVKTNTAAFARAFAAAERAGGGRIIVPRGVWSSGSIRFRSFCELHLEDGAEIVFSQDPTDCLPAVHTTWEGMECQNYCPLVYAYGCTNVALTGRGTLRGYAGDWQDSGWFPWVAQENGIRDSRLQLYTWGAEDHPVEKREIWRRPNANTRPQLIQFNRCTGVTLDGFTVRGSPFWTIHLYMCRDSYVNGLDVRAHGANNDGIDIEMSKMTFVENCRFDQGDDGVVIKSGRNRDAWRLACPTEGVFVRDCDFVDAHTLLGVGSEISGGVKNVRMVDCTIADVNRVIYIKTNRRRGGTVEGIFVDGVKAGKASDAVFAVGTDVLYEWADFPDYEQRITKICDIDVRNVVCEEAERRVKIEGDARLPVENVRLADIRVGKVRADDLVVNATNVVIDGKAVPAK